MFTPGGSERPHQELNIFAQHYVKNHTVKLNYSTDMFIYLFTSPGNGKYTVDLRYTVCTVQYYVPENTVGSKFYL